MSQKDIGNKTPLHELKTTKEVMEYYDDWSKDNKYNNDMNDWEYSGPKETSQILAKYQKDKNIKIYDAGCGSGLVGLELKKYGYSNFDGGDISKELINKVPINLYNELKQLDLNKKIPKEDDFYDVVMCVGTFTFAHVNAQALNEFVRITKKNGSFALQLMKQYTLIMALKVKLIV